MNDNNDHDQFAKRTHSKRLKTLADILGCSPDDFRLSGGGPDGIVGLSELLRLWHAIEATDDRKKVLELMQRLAAR